MSSSRKNFEKGGNVNAVNSQGLTELMRACSNSNEDLERVTSLVKRGANVNRITNKGMTALIMASQAGHLNIVKFLVANGANLNTANSDGYTALIYACIAKKVDIVKFLVKQRGINLEAAEKGGSTGGYTALMRASVVGSLEMVKTLVENGANVNATGTDGKTALTVAKGLQVATRDSNYTDIIEFLDNSTKAKAQPSLVKPVTADTSMNTLSPDQMFFLMQGAIKKGDLATIISLVKKGADVNATKPENLNALMTASYYGQLDVVKFLLTKGANVNATGFKNNTALTYASWKGHLEVVRFLVEQGKADVNAKTIDGNTASMIANQHGRAEVVKYLEGLTGKNKKQLPVNKTPNPNQKVSVSNAQVGVRLAKTRANGTLEFVVGTQKDGNLQTYTAERHDTNTDPTTNEFIIRPPKEQKKQLGGKRSRKNKTRRNKTRKNKA